MKPTSPRRPVFTLSSETIRSITFDCAGVAGSPVEAKTARCPSYGKKC